MSKSDNSDRPDDMDGFSNYSKKTSQKGRFLFNLQIYNNLGI